MQQTRKVSETLSGGEVLKLCRSFIVYGWKRKNEYLYIGKSVNGITRLDKNHKALKTDDILVSDVFDIWYCENEEEALKLEYHLIQEFKPKFNIMYNPNVSQSYVGRLYENESALSFKAKLEAWQQSRPTNERRTRKFVDLASTSKVTGVVDETGKVRPVP